jgi:hypothetical protein
MKPEEEKILGNEDNSEPKGPIIKEGSTIFTERVGSEKKEVTHKKKRSMLVQLLSLLIVVVLLGGGVTVAYYSGWFEEKEPEQVEEAEKIDIMPPKKSVIKSINIKNETGEYSIIPFKDGKEDSFKLKGYDNIPQNHEMESNIADYIMNIQAYHVLDDKWTEKDCGLDKPVIEVNVSLEKGSYSFKLGNKVPDGSGGYYCKTSLDDKIYLVEEDQYTRFSYAITDYVETNLMSAWESEGKNDIYYDDSSSSINRYDSIVMGGTHLNKEIKLTYDTDSKSTQVYLMQSPAYAYVDNDKALSLLEPFNSGLVAANAYVFNPTEQDLKDYGLDNPYSTIEYKLRGETITIKVGKGPDFDEGYYSMLFNDNDVIYKYTASQSEFLDWDDKDLRAELLFLSDIRLVETMTYDLSGEDPITYDISYYEGGEEEDPIYTVTRNSKKLDDDSFRNLFAEICLIKADDYLEEAEPDNGQPYLTLHYTYNNGAEDDVVKFTKYNDRYYRFTLNGVGDELVGYQVVDSLVNNFADFNAGKEVGDPY